MVKSKIKQTETNKETCTHTKETNTEPNKSKSKRTTRQTKEPNNKIKQLKRNLTKT